MATYLTVRIHDLVQHTSYRNPSPDPESRMIFPYLPGPSIDAHAAFELILEWSVLPGSDKWATASSGLLPTRDGTWWVVDNGGCFHRDISLAAADASSGKSSVILTLRRVGSEGDGFFRTWPDPPMEPGFAGEVFIEPPKRVNLNRKAFWKCIKVS